MWHNHRSGSRLSWWLWHTSPIFGENIELWVLKGKERELISETAQYVIKLRGSGTNKNVSYSYLIGNVITVLWWAKVMPNTRVTTLSWCAIWKLMVCSVHAWFSGAKKDLILPLWSCEGIARKCELRKIVPSEASVRWGSQTVRRN